MQYVTLNNGIKMPQLGFGVYQIPDLKQCKICTSQALEIGYRLFDTATVYQNEEAIGNALKASSISREELFITTKVWISDAGYEKTKKAFFTSLKKLGLDYLDLYLIHQPYNDVFGSWRAMEELYKDGLIKAIGVCNFAPDRLIDLTLYNDIVPMINQIEAHPFHQQQEAQTVMKEYGIQMQSWGPFAEGKNDIFQNELLADIAKNHGKSIAQVVLRWLMQRNIVAIPKSVQEKRMRENFAIFDFELSEQEMQDMVILDQKKSSFFNHRDPEMVKWLSNYKS